ncbi:hypothetical protein CONLIGDRAFT_231864 [Coniochaeta ligniaria NRRL 30616]|uniref:Uncharacterized protein n=1 Tax=Coniochaeta ligniaria NRRL 30616 TaxID=1408157 RepID=A0A1J7JV42_9PEZI|nr:hypothetical protein CONLIGDRAFT_231864 [Coniochaeta ligniaria NRRL 30616]
MNASSGVPVSPFRLTLASVWSCSVYRGLAFSFWTVAAASTRGLAPSPSHDVQLSCLWPCCIQQITIAAVCGCTALAEPKPPILSCSPAKSQIYADHWLSEQSHFSLLPTNPIAPRYFYTANRIGVITGLQSVFASLFLSLLRPSELDKIQFHFSLALRIVCRDILRLPTVTYQLIPSVYR